MNKGAKITIAIVVLLIIGGVIWFAIANQPKNNNSSQNQTPITENNDTSKTPAATITYNGSTFSPDTVTVKAGDAIKVVNSSSDELNFDSDPHPVHTDDPELNAGPIAAGQSKTFTVSTKGTWGYHNHLDSSQRGTIIVQ